MSVQINTSQRARTTSADVSSPVYRRVPRMCSLGRVMTEELVISHDLGAADALRAAIDKNVDTELSDPAGAGSSGQDAELDLAQDVPLVLADLLSSGWMLVRRATGANTPEGTDG